MALAGFVKKRPAAVETAPGGTHEKIVLYAPFKLKAFTAVPDLGLCWFFDLLLPD